MHSRAARSASSASAARAPAEAGVSGEARLDGLRSPPSRGFTIPASTSQRASLATRSTLSATEPSFSWKVIRSSFFAWSDSAVLRSCCQKKRASDRRAARTLRLPATIASPPSTAAILAVQTKALASSCFPAEAGISGDCALRPEAPACAGARVQTKYFWLVRAVSWITSGVTSRN